MSKDKQFIQTIKTNFERTIQGLKTKKDEFIFQNSQSTVREGTFYSIYYTLNKQKIYLTGLKSTSSSRLIEKINEDDLFVRYTNQKTIDRTPYPKITPAQPNESDYNIGEIRRYFAQSAVDTTKPIFEVSRFDFNRKNVLFKYVDFTWKISGTKEEVTHENKKTLVTLENEIKNISKVLPPLQLFRPKKNTGEDTRKKLSLLRKT